MKITWIGHSCFKIEEGGYSIIIDPYQDDCIPGLAPVREKANEVLKSHEHDDHNAVDNVEIVKTVASPFKITTIDTAPSAVRTKFISSRQRISGWHT